MNRQTWFSISVYDFFRTCNWTGEKIILSTLNTTEESTNDKFLLTLNLKEFLLKSNWDGKQIKSFVPESIELSNQSLLNLSIRDFCQQIVWKSPPNLAPNSQPFSSKNSMDLSSTNIDLDNLSNLF